MKSDKLLRNNDRLIRQYGKSGFSVVNDETGEAQNIPCGTKMTPPLDEINLKYKQEHVQKFKEKELFVKVYKNPIEILGRELSNRDFAWFVRLTPYINQSDCLLIDEDGQYLNIKQISSLLDVNYDNAKTVFRNFETLQLICKVDRQSKKDSYKTVKAIAVNPFIFFNGKDLSIDIHEAFIESKWANLNNDED